MNENEMKNVDQKISYANLLSAVIALVLLGDPRHSRKDGDIKWKIENWPNNEIILNKIILEKLLILRYPISIFFDLAKLQDSLEKPMVRKGN